MKGQKMQPIIGADGRLYYNYGVGAKYVFREDGKEYVFEILDCCMRNDTEYYACARDGEKYWNLFTANRIHFLLHFKLFETVSVGNQRELPLTVDEVKSYYKRKMQERDAAIKLLGNTDYFAKSKELKSIAINKTLAEAREDAEKLMELTKRETELKAKQSAILKAKKIDPVILRGAKFCTKCEGTGINGMQVCACAARLEEEIKGYNAIMRLALRAQGSE